MGYILKTTFWLGLVYYAMPLGGAVAPAVLPAASVADRSLLCDLASNAATSRLGVADYRESAAKGCSTLVAVGAAAAAGLDAQPPPPRRDSANTLTPADRKPPWRGPKRSASG